MNRGAIYQSMHFWVIAKLNPLFRLRYGKEKIFRIPGKALAFVNGRIEQGQTPLLPGVKNSGCGTMIYVYSLGG